ncbi:hypothetical protein [Reichenbachiella versicolor]|uniref:hypothetical protein n=1 Tax=Reichenbachiella versicolor TaxID=1821036 RepID=UPI000D6E1E9B|nr:hypothetical protein [Reichenbachiella versicolor]
MLKCSTWSFLVFGIFFLNITVLISCQAPEPFSNTPSIQFSELVYEEADQSNPLGIQQTDKIILTIEFTDGDGDLGISQDEVYSPYHDYDLVIDSKNNIVTFNSLPSYPLTRLERVFNGTELYWTGVESKTLDVESLPSYDCADYELLYINKELSQVVAPGQISNIPDPSNFKLDTLLKVENEFRYNMYVTFYSDNNPDGVFKPVDWPKEAGTGCLIDYNSRFQPLGTAFEGQLTYKIQSVGGGFGLALAKGQFYLECYIFDRSLNKSNTIESPKYRLSDLLNQNNNDL